MRPSTLHHPSRPYTIALVLWLTGCGGSTAPAAVNSVTSPDAEVTEVTEGCLSDAECMAALSPLPTCMVAICDLTLGICSEQEAPGGTGCDDNNVCTQGDVCLAGACLAGAATSCEDTNPCTDDSCDPVSGCTYSFNDADCDNGDACTLNDSCAEGDCTAGTATECDDDNPCTEDSCDPNNGCTFIPDPGQPCDDDDACSVGDQCSATGVCTAQSELNCDDGNPCTIDGCSSSIGCVYESSPDACDDGDICTLNDSCATGVCAGVPDPCDDDDPCTIDACLPSTGCSNTAHDGACDDGDPCTHDDTCFNGSCLGVETLCQDDNDCTIDFCHPSFGCQATAMVGSQCDDGNACTSFDACDESGVCVPGAAVVCDDSSDCTSDLCDIALGCVFTPLTSVCDDEDACTTDDVCTEGACVGTALTCEDDNPCTNDACDPVEGCVFPFSTGLCDDDDPCTVNDACLEGLCTGFANTCDDGNPCTTDTCSAAMADIDGDGELEPVPTCDHVTFVGLCEDGNACTVGDSCVSGECLSGPPASCDDEDPCTIDLCDPDEGCSHTTVPSCLPPTAWPIINEFDYEQFGDDTSDFIELLVVGEQTVELSVYTLQLIDGTTGQPYTTFALSEAGDQLHPGERLVVGAVTIVTPLFGSVATIQTDGDFLTNGGVDGDAIRLVRSTPAGDVIVDSVAYEHPVPGANEGDSHAGFDGQFTAGSLGFSRCPDGLDTDDNSFDFKLSERNPGYTNTCEEVEP